MCITQADWEVSILNREGNGDTHFRHGFAWKMEFYNDGVAAGIAIISDSSPFVLILTSC